MKIKKGQICIYCGVNPASQQEHVIPQCLFPGPLPSDKATQAVKVSACAECNGRKSQSDSYLRDMLVVDNDVSQHPHAQALLDGQVTRAIRTNRSVLVREAMPKMRWKPRYTSGGIYIGHCYQMKLDQERVDYIFTMIVKGLYFKKFSRRLPEGAVVDVVRVEPFSVRRVWQDFQRAGCNGPYRVGDVFGCLLMYVDEDPSLTAWLMWFYENIYFLIYTKSAHPEV